MGLFFSHYSLVLTLSVPRPLGSVTVKGGLEFLCRETHRGRDRAEETVARPPSAVERTGLSWMMHQTCQRASIRHNGPQGLTGNDSALCWQLIFWREAMRARAITLLPQLLPPQTNSHSPTTTGAPLPCDDQDRMRLRRTTARDCRSQAPSKAVKGVVVMVGAGTDCGDGAEPIDERERPEH